MRRLFAPLALLLVAGSASAQSSQRPWFEPTLVFETGPAYVAQNDGEYGATGTRYDADDVGQQDNLVRISRTSLELTRCRHTLILLYAPFELRTQVELDRDLQFRDKLFAAGTVVDHRYLFDGYRASYLYKLVDRPALTLEVGASVQIRNADVAFVATDGSQRANEEDIGVVGAAKVRVRYRPQPHGPWGAFEADALSTFGLISAVEGALYDAQLTIGYPVAQGIDLFLGARLLGGGADVESQQIYNWGNFVSFTAGARVALADVFTRR